MTAETRFLRSIEGKTKRDKIRNEKIGENLKVNTLEGKLTDSRMRWYGHMKGKHPRGRVRSRWE
jgi:hypothetical protein